MKITIAHNRYLQAGGEDRVVAAEAEMLASRGHEVDLLQFDNEKVMSPTDKALVAIRTLYSRPSFRRTSDRLEAFRPDIVHVHNFMPVMSPSIFFAAEKFRTPTVLTLHNYRLICSNAFLFREGRICEECVDSRSFIPAVRYACYRESRLGSAVVGGTMALHDVLGTWSKKIHRYIALTDFAAGALGKIRIPAEKIRVKPNFVVDPGEGTGTGGYALFVGRLSAEKGIDTILKADEQFNLDIPVLIVGIGPMLEKVRNAAARPGTRLQLLGGRSSEEVLALMKSASVLLVPSLWYEGFPMVILEALSVGLPILASRIGGLPEIVKDKVSGLLHEPGSVPSFTAALGQFAAMGALERQLMRRAARHRYLSKYSEAENYRTLLKIYSEAISTHAA